MNKRLFALLFAVIGIMMCFSMTACEETTLEQLVSDYGITIDGGEFKKGSLIKAEQITSKEIISEIETIIENQEYDANLGMYIFDISVIKDGAKVQPNGKVTVTMPAPRPDAREYVVFHIKDDKSVEKLNPTFADGKITFETDSFSYFVIAGAPKYSLTIRQKGSGMVYVNGISVEKEFYTERFFEHENITLTVIKHFNEFMGWYEIDENSTEFEVVLKDTPVSTDENYMFTMTDSDYTLYAVFGFSVSEITLDATDAGFTESEAIYTIGDENRPRPEDVIVYGVTVEENIYLKKDVDYTIDLGGLDFEVAGTYTITYTYKKDTTIKETLTIKVVERTYSFNAYVYNNGGLIRYNNEEQERVSLTELLSGTTIELEAVANRGYNFVGWYEIDDSIATHIVLKDTPISTEQVHTFVVTEAYTIYAVFEAKVTGLNLDAANAGFTEGEATYTIGEEYRPTPENVIVKAVTVEENIYLKKDVDYTIDLGGLDFEVAGTYTITYTYKKDTTIKETLRIVVQDRIYIFSAVVEIGGCIYYNNEEQTNGCQLELTKGSTVTLNAVADEYYNFVGWYNMTTTDEITLISTNAEYTFTVIEDTYVIARFEEKPFHVLTIEIQGSGKITTEGIEEEYCFQNEYYSGQSVEVTAVANTSYKFVGWYEIDLTDDGTIILRDTPISTESTYIFTIGEADYTVCAVFEADIIGLSLDAANAGFTEGEAIYTIGEEYRPRPENVIVYGTTEKENIYLEKDVDYTIDLGGLDFEVAGTYTITYTYKKDTTITEKLRIVVQDRMYIFSAVVEIGGCIYYNNEEQTNGCRLELTKGSTVTLNAVADEYYNFVGWYNMTTTDEITLISTNAEYTFTVIEDTFVIAIFEEKPFHVLTIEIQGSGKITTEGIEEEYCFQNEYYSGQSVEVTAVANTSYKFVGWYEIDLTDDGTIILRDTPISTESTYTFTIGESDYTVCAVFEADIIGLNLDAANAGFTEGEAIYTIGEEYRPTPENVIVYGVTEKENIYLEKDVDYTIDLGGLDFEVAGTYTITYTYKKDLTITETLRIVVQDRMYIFSAVVETGGCIYYNNEEQTGGCQLELTKSSTVTLNAVADEYYNFVGWYNITTTDEITLISTNAEYTFTVIEDTYVIARFEEISSTEINLTYEGSAYDSKYNGGRAAYVFKESIKNNGETCDIESLGLSYEWRNYETNEVVSVARDDTWGTDAPHYPSPAVVGTYDFVVYKEENGIKIDFLTVTRTIIANKFELLTDISSLSEYTYYTVIAKVGDSYYAMSNPFDGTTEREAINVTPDENGIISLGENYEYVFRPYDTTKRTANNDVLYGCRTGAGPYKTGKLILWGENGNIQYETSTSADYTITIELNDDGTARIHAPYCKGTLRLVYDEIEQKYLFTAQNPNTDTRTSYDVYLYSEYVEPEPEPTEVYEYIGSELSKEYDGEAVSFNVYKDVYICTENGETIDIILKCETGRFVWTGLKGEIIMVGICDEYGNIAGPSDIGYYCLEFQTQEKGEDGMVWVTKAILHRFEIIDPTIN